MKRHFSKYQQKQFYWILRFFHFSAKNCENAKSICTPYRFSVIFVNCSCCTCNFSRDSDVKWPSFFGLLSLDRNSLSLIERMLIIANSFTDKVTHECFVARILDFDFRKEHNYFSLPWNCHQILEFCLLSSIIVKNAMHFSAFIVFMISWNRDF